MTLSWLGHWLAAFVLTQPCEIGIYANAPGGPERPLRERLAIAFGASAITHPVVWFVITPLYIPLEVDWWTMVAIAETFAVVTEGLWLLLFGHRALAAFGTSLAANGLSFIIGLFCYEALGW